jgi:hypothetical protein
VTFVPARRASATSVALQSVDAALSSGDNRRISRPSGIEAKWEAVIDGRLTREAVHDWAEPFVLHERGGADVMVLSALQQLHGFDLTGDRSGDPFELTHGPPGQYIRSIEGLSRYRPADDGEPDRGTLVVRARGAERGAAPVVSRGAKGTALG